MILRGNVFSKVMEMDTGITVVVPNRFRSGKPYRVVYLLHGLCGDSDSWTDNTLLPVYANEHPILFVMPQVARSLYTDMKYGQKFFTYIADELPMICKSVFNISAAREDTIVMGASMGAYGALKCALTHPERYGFCFAFGTACLYLGKGLEYQRQQGEAASRKLCGEQMARDFRAIFGENLEWKPEHDVVELAKRVVGVPLQPEFYSFCGTEDELREDNRKFALEAEDLGLNFTYREWKGGHDWFFFNETLKEALDILERKDKKQLKSAE